MIQGRGESCCWRSGVALTLIVATLAIEAGPQVRTQFTWRRAVGLQAGAPDPGTTCPEREIPYGTVSMADSWPQALTALTK